LASLSLLSYLRLMIWIILLLADVGLNPPYVDTNFYAIVTRDASPYAGASDLCNQNMRLIWDNIFQMAKSSDGRQQLQKTFNLCEPLDPQYQGYDLADWIQSAWSYLAMGNYPYPSSYITNGDGVLPAYPVRVACDPMSQTFGKNQSEVLRLLLAASQAVGVFYNATGTMTCYDINGSVNNDTANDSNFWGYQWCTEMVQPFASNGKTDMFFPLPFNYPAQAVGCDEQWGVIPRPLWVSINYGGWRIEAGSNIVWSNGDYDPWMAGMCTDCTIPLRGAACVHTS
jgi:lysosomal Pro-X carboxypeptidase